MALSNFLWLSIFRVRFSRVREIDTRCGRNVEKDIMHAAEFAVFLVFLVPVAPEIAQLLQSVQSAHNGRRSVHADGGETADREFPVFRKAQAEAEQAKRFQIQPFVLEDAVVDPGEGILAADHLKCVVQFSSPAFGDAEAHAKNACAMAL